jgi:hypothetical protein
MTEDEWLACDDPRPMMEFLRAKRSASRTKGGKRRLRLFACVCVRGIWPLLRQVGSRQALYYAELYADGQTTEYDLATANRAARVALAHESGEIGNSPYWQSAEAAGHLTVKRFDGEDHPSVTHASHSAASAWAMDRTRSVAGSTHGTEFRARQAVHADWLRDIFGNPFRSVSFSASWRTDTAVSLARQMYESRDFSAMPILADALQDAGCDSDEVLNHCRDAKQVHVRGCWVVDLVLDKK